MPPTYLSSTGMLVHFSQYIHHVQLYLEEQVMITLPTQEHTAVVGIAGMAVGVW